MTDTPTQIKEDTIRRLVDYVLLNACAENYTGLYSGKAGISVCLFEMQRELKDNYIEKQSLELLRESLLTKNNDISFENGLSGIGFSLLYLINNKFVNADFYDLFDINLDKILSTITLWKEKDETIQIFNNVSILYFLDYLFRYSKRQEYNDYIELIYNTINDMLEAQFEEISSFKNTYFITSVVSFFEKYLKILHSCPQNNYSKVVIDSYSKLYMEGRLSSNFAVGHYLNAIATEINNNKIKHVAEENMKYAIIGINPQLMTISEKTELLFLLSSYEKKYHKEIYLLENELLNFNSNIDLEISLLKDIPSVSSIGSYNSGITRYLLYWVFKKHRDTKRNYERFKNIF